MDEARMFGGLAPPLSHYDQLQSLHELSVSDYNKLGDLNRSGHGFDNYLVHWNET